MVNHGLTTGAIFFLVGVIWERRGTLRFTDLGGLQRAGPDPGRHLPGGGHERGRLPGLNGFVGEFLVLVGTFITHRWWAVVGTSAIVSGGHLHAVGVPAGVPGPVRTRPTPRCAISRWREIGAVAPLLAGIVFLGVYPRPFLDRVTPSVSHLLAHVQRVDPAPTCRRSGQAAINYSVPADQNVDALERRERPRSSGGLAGAAPVCIGPAG